MYILFLIMILFIKISYFLLVKTFAWRWRFQRETWNAVHQKFSSSKKVALPKSNQFHDDEFKFPLVGNILTGLIKIMQ